MPNSYDAPADRMTAPAPLAWLAGAFFGARRTAPLAAAQPAADTPDLLIRRRVLARLERVTGWNPATANVFVKDGEVILQGLIHHHAARRTVREAVASVPHVRSVRDDRVPAREWQAMA